MVDSNVYNFLFIIYIISSSGIIAVKIVGISLSRETMESAPRFSQGLSCSACCGVQSDSGSAGSVAVVTDEIQAWLYGN